MIDFSKLKGKIFFNNKFINCSDAKIHVLNHSLHFASSVFEGIAVYNSIPLYPTDHFKRFKKSSKIFKLKLNISLKQFNYINKKLISHNKIVNGYIRPILFRSNHSMSPDTKDCKSILAIAAWSWGKLFSKKGISLDISCWPKLNKKIYPIEAKSSGSYQSSVISRVNAQKKGYDDCLMLDTKGYVAETSACNIFWIKRNRVYTPSINSSLDGITRQSVKKICKKLNIKLKIGDYKISEILKSELVFVTGTAAEIQLVNRIKNKKFNLENNTFHKIKKAYENIKSKPPKSC